METSISSCDDGESDTFNFLASLINGNDWHGCSFFAKGGQHF